MDVSIFVLISFFMLILMYCLRLIKPLVDRASAKERTRLLALLEQEKDNAARCEKCGEPGLLNGEDGSVWAGNTLAFKVEVGQGGMTAQDFVDTAGTVSCIKCGYRYTWDD